MADVTSLDVKWLKTFINEDVQHLRNELDKIMKNDGVNGGAIREIAEGRPTPQTVDTVRPLVIGPMAKDDYVQGQSFNGSVLKTAAGIQEVLDAQTKLWADIEDNLASTIEEMAKTQQGNLAQIKSGKFVDLFADVESDLGGYGSADPATSAGLEA